MVFTESNTIGDESIGARTDADPKAMTNTSVFAILHLYPDVAQCRKLPFHGGRSGDSVLLTDNHRNGWIIG